MMLRIFTATIPLELHQEFKAKFLEISVPLVKNYKGLISLEIAEPTEWNPNEFVMVSRWETVDDLINFAGTHWNEAHIPQGMEQYIEHCSVQHYKNIDIPV
jgi:heme-degrading monooxygenase HmoA